MALNHALVLLQIYRLFILTYFADAPLTHQLIVTDKAHVRCNSGVFYINEMDYFETEFLNCL